MHGLIESVLSKNIRHNKQATILLFIFERQTYTHIPSNHTLSATYLSTTELEPSTT